MAKEIDISGKNALKEQGEVKKGREPMTKKSSLRAKYYREAVASIKEWNRPGIPHLEAYLRSLNGIAPIYPPLNVEYVVPKEASAAIAQTIKDIESGKVERTPGVGRATEMWANSPEVQEKHQNWLKFKETEEYANTYGLLEVGTPKVTFD